LHRSGTYVSAPGPASWAPDSRHVVGSMVDDNVQQVVVADTATSATQHIGPGRAPQWAPRGTTLAYIGPDGLYVAQLGQPPTRLGTGQGDFAWSPDGARIAYRDGSGALAVVDAPVGAPTIITTATVSGPIRWS